MTNQTLPPTVQTIRRNPGCLIQLLWFCFVGSWLSLIWVAVAWVVMLTIIGLPVGIMMINYLPKIVALREPWQQELTQVQNTATGKVVVIKTMQDLPQISLIVRIFYFLFIGWWFSALWLLLAWLASLTIIGLPLAFWMVDRTPAILTLRRQ